MKSLHPNRYLRHAILIALAGTFIVNSHPLFAQNAVGTALRAEVNLNGDWSYIFNQSDDQIPHSGWQTRRVPETPIADGSASVWYQHTLNLPQSWIVPGRSYYLKLEKAGHYAAVYWNGNLVSNHFGQYSPFEADVTSFVIPGQNTIDIYVHKADTIYVRPGANITQHSCPQGNPDCIGNSYRPNALSPEARNWVGIAGDITFSWRPTEHITDVFIQPSVQTWNLLAQIQAVGGSPTATVQATVLDGSTPVLTLPAQSITSGEAMLNATWTNPVLWGPSPYGEAKLYTLQTDLLENGTVVDTEFSRFGFREVWISGKDIFLNGQKLWFTGTYGEPLDLIRYVNDRRPQGQFLFIMESSGVNLLQWHWDDPGDSFLNVADEMGILVLGSFFCDGNLQDSQVDSVPAWTEWMISTAQEWITDRRKHTSIVIWRPVDRGPEGVPESNMQQIVAAAEALDPTRPFADTNPSPFPIDSFAQRVSFEGACYDGSTVVGRMARNTKPLLERELTNYQSPCLSEFLDSFYQEGYLAGVSGMIANDLSLFNPQNFVPDWFSISGPGNRPQLVTSLANWTAPWTASSSGMELEGLYQAYVQPTLLQTSPTSGEYQASNLPAGAQTAFLSPANGNLGQPLGILVAEDGSGTAWFTVPQPGSYQLIYNPGTGDVITNVTVTPPNPYGFVSVTPNPVWFPMQPVGSNTPATQVALYNNEPFDLPISSIAITGTDVSDFTQTNNCPATLPRGTQCTVSVAFNPTAIGSRTATLAINDNAPGSPHTTSLSGAGSLVFLSPNPLVFGDQAMGSPGSSQNLTLKNQSGAAVAISSIFFSGNNPQDFTESNNCPVFPNSLGAGASCSITVVFTPTLSGPRAAVLNVIDNANPRPQTASLAGSGTFGSLSPGSLNFGSVKLGNKSASQTATLTNVSIYTPLLIAGIAVTGPNASDFTQTNNCPVEPNFVSPEKACTISLTFAPSAIGQRTATLAVSDSGGGSPQLVALSGTGTD